MLSSVFVKMVLAVMALLLSSVPSATDIVLPDGASISVEVARTVSEQRRGLGGRDDIGDGMLFCYRDAQTRRFWMKDMRVPLDVVWLRDGRVIGVVENIPVFSEFYEHTEAPFSLYTVTDWTGFATFAPVDAVLELPAGAVAAHGITEGDVLSGGACLK